MKEPIYYQEHFSNIKEKAKKFYAMINNNPKIQVAIFGAGKEPYMDEEYLTYTIKNNTSDEEQTVKELVIALNKALGFGYSFTIWQNKCNEVYVNCSMTSVAI